MIRYLKKEYPHSTTWLSVSDNRDEDPNQQTFQNAEVTLQRGSITPNFYWDDQSKEHIDVKYGGSDTLFDVQNPRISGAYADPTLRHTVPTLLAMAANRGGKATEADYELSQHSSRLAKKAIKAGLIQGSRFNKKAAPTFDSDRNSNNFLFRKDIDPFSPVPDEELAAGKDTVRRFIRSSSTKRSPRSKRPQQLSLFQFGDQ